MPRHAPQASIFDLFNDFRRKDPDWVKNIQPENSKKEEEENGKFQDSQDHRGGVFRTEVREDPTHVYKETSMQNSQMFKNNRTHTRGEINQLHQHSQMQAQQQQQMQQQRQALMQPRQELMQPRQELMRTHKHKCHHPFMTDQNKHINPKI